MSRISVAADCGKCHTSTSTTGTDITGAIHTDGTIDVTIAGAYDNDATPGNNYTPGDGFRTCSNVYCHGDTLTAGTDTTPQWGGAVACGECHGDDAATPPTAGSHVRHAGNAAGGLSRACTDCHGAGAGGSGHVNDDVAWDLSAIDASATYSGSNTGATGAQAPCIVTVTYRRQTERQGRHYMRVLHGGRRQWCVTAVMDRMPRRRMGSLPAGRMTSTRAHRQGRTTMPVQPVTIMAETRAQIMQTASLIWV
jgi:predicted CxxxxCH...CXXCH cytochrome family protein